RVGGRPCPDGRAAAGAGPGRELAPVGCDRHPAEEPRVVSQELTRLRAADRKRFHQWRAARARGRVDVLPVPCHADAAAETRVVRHEPGAAGSPGRAIEYPDERHAPGAGPGDDSPEEA